MGEPRSPTRPLLMPLSSTGRWLSVLCACCLLGLVACASSSFRGQLYEANDLAFRTGPIDPSWHRVDARGARLAFRDDSRDATIAVFGRCGRDAQDVPLAALTQHLFLQFTERNVLEQRLVAMDGREALRTRMDAKLDGVAKSFLVYVMKKDGCVYDLLLIGRSSAFASASEAFDIFASRFSVIDKGGS